MQTLMILVTAVAGAAFALALLRFVRARTWAKREPVEYFGGWGGYRHPIGLTDKITKEEADARAASGVVYLIGHFDADNRLVRAIKMYQGAVFFDFAYTYHPNGTRKSARITNNKGVTSERAYDTSGRGTEQHFW
jgi:voltage-gated potassium channel Kch